jgi:hypothetical protein
VNNENDENNELLINMDGALSPPVPPKAAYTPPTEVRQQSSIENDSQPESEPLAETVPLLEKQRVPTKQNDRTNIDDNSLFALLVSVDNSGVCLTSVDLQPQPAVVFSPVPHDEPTAQPPTSSPIVRSLELCFSWCFK